MINSFPKQKGYHINWLGGSGGGFLLTLTYLFEKGINRSRQTVDIKTGELISFPHVTDTAMAHNNIGMIDANWDREQRFRYYQEFVRKVPVYEVVKAHDNRKPIFFYDHYPADPYKLFTMYPLLKLLVISLNEMDKQVCYGNLFLKTNNMFEEIKTKNPELFKDCKTQFDIPVDILQTYIETACSSLVLSDFFNKDMNVDEVHVDKIYKIDFIKLISNKEYILDTLSSITKKPVTNTAEDFTVSYLVKHKNLIKKRLPWLVDYVYQK